MTDVHKNGKYFKQNLSLSKTQGMERGNLNSFDSVWQDEEGNGMESHFINPRSTLEVFNEVVSNFILIRQLICTILMEFIGGKWFKKVLIRPYHWFIWWLSDNNNFYACDSFKCHKLDLFIIAKINPSWYLWQEDIGWFSSFIAIIPHSKKNTTLSTGNKK